MFGWHIPSPDEAMLISGAKGRDDAAPFKIVKGHGAFVFPLRSKVSFLTLSMQEAEVLELQRDPAGDNAGREGGDRYAQGWQ